MEATSQKESAWRLESGAPLLWVECGGEHIIFHPGSGETHYLNDLSALVLRCMEEGPVTESELYERLVELLGERPLLTSQLSSLLGRFDQLGIVEQAERTP